MKIKGYENYEVTTTGEVINTKTGRVLKPFKSKKGYLQVSLSKNGKEKIFLIHRLVAEAFIPNPENLPQVNHKDEDKTNNYVGTRESNYTDGNLEWCTHEYNQNYGTRNKRIAIMNINGIQSKTVLQLRKDGSLVRIWPSAREVQRQLHFNQGNINQCCLGKRHSANGYKWSYAKQ